MSRISTLSERIQNTPGLMRDTVALVVCIAIAIACGGYILAHQSWQAPWTDQYTFSAELDKAPAVRPESLQEVRIAGVSVGRITGAEPTDTGIAKITMSIDPDQTVYENARILVRTKSPLNVMYVTLDPGGPPAAPLEEGGTLPMSQASRLVQPNEIFDKLDERARFGLTSMINELDVAMASNPKNLGVSLTATRDAMSSFEPVLAALEKRRANLASLVTSLSKIAAAAGEDDARMARLTEASHDALSAIAVRDDELSSALAQLPGFTDELRDSMGSVEALSTELDPTLDDLTRASEELPGALTDLTGTVGAIREFINGAAPVVDQAGPITRDLRPVIGDTQTALKNIAPTASYLPSATQKIVPWMEDLAAFIYQTSSAFSLFDANGGLGRANVNVDLTNPSGGLQGEGIPGYGAKR